MLFAKEDDKAAETFVWKTGTSSSLAWIQYYTA
jgi:hypothetical protein